MQCREACFSQLLLQLYCDTTQDNPVQSLYATAEISFREPELCIDSFTTGLGRAGQGTFVLGCWLGFLGSACPVGRSVECKEQSITWVIQVSCLTAVKRTYSHSRVEGGMSAQDGSFHQLAELDER